MLEHGTRTTPAGVRNGSRAARGLAALAVALAAVAGCSRNGGEIPGSFVPEGQFGFDNGLIVEVRALPIDSTTSEPIVDIRIFDRTVADGYRVYRRVDGGPYDEAVDYAASFSGAFNGGWSTYQAIDRNFVPGTVVEYLGRATVGGVESRVSPLTNTAIVPALPLDSLLAKDFRMLAPIDTAMTDSVPLMSWESVPGAVRYSLELIRADNRLFVLVLTPPNGSTTYKVGSRAGTVLQEKILTPSNFFWTVSAIDAQNRVIARTRMRQIFQVVSAVPPPR